MVTPNAFILFYLFYFIYYLGVKYSDEKAIVKIF